MSKDKECNIELKEERKREQLKKCEKRRSVRQIREAVEEIHKRQPTPEQIRKLAEVLNKLNDEEGV